MKPDSEKPVTEAAAAVPAAAPETESDARGAAGDAEPSAGPAEAPEASEAAEGKTEASDGVEGDERVEKVEKDEKAGEAASGESGSAPARGRRGLKIAAGAVLALAIAAAAGWWQVRSILYERPVAMAHEEIVTAVGEGDNARRVLVRLAEEGLELPLWQARLLMRLEPGLARMIHVGRFRFTRGMTPHDVLQTLSGPALVDRQLRIPDGAPIWVIEAILAEAEDLKPDSARLSDAELAKRLGLADIAGSGGHLSLEGLFAPETYRYGAGTSDVTILRQAAERQRTLLTAAWEGRSTGCAVSTPYELLILASIIEKETGVRSDRHLVSSVFNNRLRIGMPLQTDPTVIYGLGPTFSGNITKRDLKTPTPWNTYVIPGLPPTPIAMPSAASIEAAAHPAETKYLYFVARGDGTSEFSTNLSDHNRAVRRFILKRGAPAKAGAGNAAKAAPKAEPKTVPKTELKAAPGTEPKAAAPAGTAAPQAAPKAEAGSKAATPPAVAPEAATPEGKPDAGDSPKFAEGSAGAGAGN